MSTIESEGMRRNGARPSGLSRRCFLSTPPVESGATSLRGAKRRSNPSGWTPDTSRWIASLRSQ
ncbi:MAG: hypothetical protein E7774_15220 [Bradyrhizobium sp.]|nr:MAG: hypothetical protein E7774_15220 [Bradyrhizobium sp.]